jgi:hypothetical protein
MPMPAPRVGRLAEAVQAATGGGGDLAYVDQGYTEDERSKTARARGIAFQVVRAALPVERSFARATRFRRLVKDIERYPVRSQISTSSLSSASCSNRPLDSRAV